MEIILRLNFQFRSIEDEKYINRRYALLPHSNCLTRGEENPCKNCIEGKENLCVGMVHAGLDKDTPSGFTEKMFVDKRWNNGIYS